ncbi:MAG: hypothetical protein M3Y22_05505, partial [Pseudomonadota bacterium]|nr:hypothetical protein [Pseudomonadota bacterium]
MTPRVANFAGALLLATCIMVVPRFSTAQELWHGARVGMSVADVKKTIPDARAPTTPDTSSNGMLELLETNSVPVGGHK